MKRVLKTGNNQMARKMKIKYIILLALLSLLTANAQNFTDDFKSELASQWEAVKGIKVTDELGGKKVLKVDRYTVVKPIVDGQTTNYLGDQFTIEFDAFFDEVSTPTRQYYIIHLWDGTGVYGENGQHTDPYLIYRHGITASGSFKNNKKIKELAILEQTWRHIKVDYAQQTLKIYIDDQLIHHQPNLFYKPRMVSFSARNASGESSGITNFKLIGETEKNLDAVDGLKIILITDNVTKKVKNIELFETMKDLTQVNKKYPKSSFYSGVLNGKYTVRMKILVDTEKPDWNNIMTTGNYTIEPTIGSVISINTKDVYVPGGQFLPLKGAKSFLSNQNVLPFDLFAESDKFTESKQLTVGRSFNFGIINTKILENEDGVVVFKTGYNNPIGFEPVQNPTGEIITPIISNEPYKPIDATTVVNPIETEINVEPNQQSTGSSVQNSPTINNDIKLRVTLKFLHSAEGRDKGNNPDDYGLQQSIEYVANNHAKIATDEDIRLFSNSNCNLQLGYNKNVLICGDKNNQIHTDFTSTINNSLIFTITPDEFNDESAKMVIYTWLKEYTSNDDKVVENTKINVKIHEVLVHLLTDWSAEKPWVGTSTIWVGKDNINSILDYDNYYKYDLWGVAMWLRKTDRNTLEGPIVLEGAGVVASTWIHFEIVK